MDQFVAIADRISCGGDSIVPVAKAAPKFVFFHAFKGGTGRTYALVNVANLCARDGANVVVVDLDVEAPGIAAQYDLKPPDYKRGFVDYARETLDLSEAALPVVDVPVQGRGSLKVIPAGDPFSEDYWESLISDQWAKMLEEGTAGKNFWRRTRLKIEALRPRPDLVLIDGRAGLAELSVAVIRDLEPYVMSFINRAQPETPKGTQILLKNLVRRSDKNHAVVGLVRRPSVTQTEAFQESEFATRVERSEDDLTWLRKNFGDLAERTMVLTWDLEIELGGKHVVPRSGDIRTGSDYWPDIHAIASHLSPRPLKIPVGERVGWEAGSPVKWFLLEGGQMLNMSDRAPNLSFRVETFRGLLDSLWTTVEGADASGAVGDQIDENFGVALEESGFAAGENFGVDYAADLPHADMSEVDKLHRWCDFDSAVGFGRMHLEKRKSDARGIRGAIVVEENAFASDRGEDDHDLCRFLVGYFKGVLTAVLGGPVRVDHGMCMRLGGAVCKFAFRRIE